MSLNPRIGHLYHDHNISNDFTALDAKETLRTREINAREAKFLERYSHVIDRAKNTCLKHNAWEQREVRKTLETIKSKTPSLSKGLCMETERKRLREFRTSNSHYGSSGSGSAGLPVVRTSTCKPNSNSLLNPWSVYSQRPPDTRGRTQNSTRNDDRRQSKRRNSIYNDSGQMAIGLTKTEILVRKAEHIIKGLHTLYTKGVERKRRENNTTVLEILGRESREELEKALFVLRGTSTGDVIEDILREKEHISKTGNKRNKSMNSNERIRSTASDTSGQDSLDEHLTIRKSGKETRNFGNGSDESLNSRTSSNVVTNEEIAHNEQFLHLSQGSDYSTGIDKVLLNIDEISDNNSVEDTTWDTVFRDETSQTRDAQNGSVDIREIFERDATWTMSSVVANPSELGYHPCTKKWTELLKAPELWKTNIRAVKNTKLTNPKPRSLVTLAGKSRRTLLNK